MEKDKRINNYKYQANISNYCLPSSSSFYILKTRIRYNVRNIFTFHRSVTSSSPPPLSPAFIMLFCYKVPGYHVATIRILTRITTLFIKGRPQTVINTPLFANSRRNSFPPPLLSASRISIKLVARAPRRSVQVSRLCVIPPEDYARSLLFVLV